MARKMPVRKAGTQPVNPKAMKIAKASAPKTIKSSGSRPRPSTAY